MTLKETLLADLARQYHFDGTPARKPSAVGIWKRLLNPRFSPVVLCRLAYAMQARGMRALGRLFALLNFLWFGIEIAQGCEIGGGLFLPHTIGTVIGAQRIGRNATIFQGVTLGAKEIDIGYHPELRPLLGDNVTVGSGAKVLGGIIIGDDVVIGANAVVVVSLPPGCVAGGVPARVLRQINEENDKTNYETD